MTGEKLKRKLMAQLVSPLFTRDDPHRHALHDALAPCVVLKPEEAAELLAYCKSRVLGGWQDHELHALLTPSAGREGQVAPVALAPAEDDIGPPAPGEGDDLPNPELEMKC